MHREPECYSAAEERALEEDEALARIELVDGGPPRWLKIIDPHMCAYVADASDATRFSRERDAQDFLRCFRNSDPNCRVTAHGWMETLSDSDAARADRVLQVFARYQRELQKGGSQRAPSDTLIIAASLTTAHFSAMRAPLKENADG